MKQESKAERQSSPEQAGLAAWLLKRVREKLRGERQLPRLALVERIALAPRQSLALVEAEGRRFLVATSQEGGPAFYALDHPARPALNRAGRVSW
jgi:flagellar biogenesis protein FliO